MPAPFILNTGALIASLHQEGLLERAFHDPLLERLIFRDEAFKEEAEGNLGTTIFMTRRGLLPAVTTPTRATDGEPQPQILTYEQWLSTLQRYNGALDTSVSESRHALADKLRSNIQALGVQAGQSINLIARNGLYAPYCGGNTVTIDAAAAPDTTIHVASLSGFRFVVLRGQNVAPAQVSTSFPLSVTIAGVTGPRNVIGAAPDDPLDPDGPGILTLSAALGAVVAARAAVLAFNRPEIIRAGGGTSVDAIGASDILSPADVIAAVTSLRQDRVEPHDDGYYHVHVPPLGEGQLFSDSGFQRLNTALPDSVRYQKLAISTLYGAVWYSNPACPDDSSSGDLVQTGTNAFYSRDIHAETVNNSGVRVGRAIVTGKGTIYERWFDSKQYVSEVGIAGQQGDFAGLQNNGVEINTDGFRLIVLAPIDRLADKVRKTWDYVGDFPAPSDVAAGSPRHYKRSRVIEFALT